MNERDLRAALKTQLVIEHREEPETQIVEELAIPHGATRIDVAVINGLLHGYEIKSNSDTLERLAAQSHAYCGVFDRLTLVVGERHLREAVELIPDWWGIRVARSRSGSVIFRDLRLPIQNPAPQPLALAILLWKTEAATLLHDVDDVIWPRSISRAILHRVLVEKMAVEDLRARVRCCLKERRLGVTQA